MGRHSNSSEVAKAIFVVVIFWLVFGVVMTKLTQTPQKDVECRSRPGHCDIDTDWRPRGQ